ncbi:malate dehydrogenase [Acidithiobacillus ferrivorans]|uniref:Malate dehydrogenase n=1 Tax=Acidithiobacillus ferrivorans TaxID=160808 RepID=A0A7T5BJ20_9PROT|nr:malate dehydrogenase [Acidithiobacillus ferrivorans]MBN6740413.1 malate dehydrogenase [Acidithiobacillus sp. MC6.1]QQD73863.1 malate dehydrogenase [Acidithiobacillus ferrivorans]
MDIAIIGANGSTGKHMASRILLEKILLPTDRLQLVGRSTGASASALYGFRQDLKDAFAEHCPIIDIALRPEEIVADIILMTAGSTIHPHANKDEPPPSRDELASYNRAMAIPYAEAIAKYGYGHEIVIVVTNPVELIVQVFADHYDRRRVIGMGAYQDSLRFRREVARSINVSREAVRAMVLGEHGDGIVPLWSSVTVQGFSESETARAIRQVRSSTSSVQFPETLQRLRDEIIQIAQSGHMSEAFQRFDTLPPDVRVMVGPFLTLFSGAKTDIATAHATVDLVKSILSGKDTVIAAQVVLDGEFLSVSGPVGAPVVISPKGWDGVYPVPLSDGEQQLFFKAVQSIQRKLLLWNA